MRVAMFSTKSYVRTLLENLNASHRHEFVYFATPLGLDTASLATGFPAVSVFVNDVVDRDVLKQLAAGGTKLVATLSTLSLDAADLSHRQCANARPGVTRGAVDQHEPRRPGRY
jgi:lactate dehydrogenase-like 2-hydroxyacid dehydrogenase